MSCRSKKSNEVATGSRSGNQRSAKARNPSDSNRAYRQQPAPAHDTSSGEELATASPVSEKDDPLTQPTSRTTRALDIARFFKKINVAGMEKNACVICL